MDNKIFKAFYGFTFSHKRFAKTLFFCDRLFPYVFAIIFITLGTYAASNRTLASLLLYVCVPLITITVSLITRKLINRPRPNTHFNIEGRYATKSKPSFPSNHVSSATAIAFACLYISSPIGIAVLCLAIITSLCRIFCGAHYPSDVLAGFVLAALMAIAGYSWIDGLL